MLRQGEKNQEEKVEPQEDAFPTTRKKSTWQWLSFLHTVHPSQLQVTLPAAKELSLRAFHLLAGTHFGVSKLEGDEKGNPTFLPGERIKMKRFFLFSSARSSWHLS